LVFVGFGLWVLTGLGTYMLELVGSDPGWFGFRVLNANESLLNNSKERGLNALGFV
jgi:hypothetical protein